MASVLPPVPKAFGVIVVDGHPYIERPQIFTSVLAITTPRQVVTNVPVTLPAVAPFLLKGLTRDILTTDGFIPVGSFDRRFRFNLRNSQGSTWFFTSGLWIFDDRVIDTMAFGSGQFPYPLIPPVPIPANGTMFYDVEDMSLGASPNFEVIYPYTIHFGFHGSYLFPTNT
jgi:hypothetical protein